MSGVYQIYNTVNGKRYIGSSIHIEQRFKEHLRNLRANKHVNANLQSAWNKYGEHSFVFEEVELCEPDQCLKVEAARQLGIDNGAVTYCIRNTQGYCKKLNCTFVQISKEEYEEATA